MLKYSLAVIGLSLGLDLKRSGTELTIASQMDLGTELQRMLFNLARSGHPIFRGTSALERGQSRSKEGGKTSIHFNGNTKNMELLLQMVISVNQLSLYGAAMIEELPVGERAPENPLHQVNWKNKKLLHNLLSQKCKPMKSDRETCCKNTSNDLRNCQKTRSYPDCAPKQV